MKLCVGEQGRMVIPLDLKEVLNRFKGGECGDT